MSAHFPFVTSGTVTARPVVHHLTAGKKISLITQHEIFGINVIILRYVNHQPLLNRSEHQQCNKNPKPDTEDNLNQDTDFPKFTSANKLFSTYGDIITWLRLAGVSPASHFLNLFDACELLPTPATNSDCTRRYNFTSSTPSSGHSTINSLKCVLTYSVKCSST